MKRFEVIGNKFHEIKSDFSEPYYGRIVVGSFSTKRGAFNFARKHGYMTVREIDYNSGKFNFYEVS